MVVPITWQTTVPLQRMSSARSVIVSATLRQLALRWDRQGQMMTVVLLHQNNASLALEYQPESAQANYNLAFAAPGDHHSFPTPPALLLLAPAENEASGMFVKCCLDTGAAQIHKQIARQAGHVLKPPRIGMNSITGPMDIVGDQK